MAPDIVADMVNADCVGDAENARHENARNAIVWNTACCICPSIAEQECMSRQERAPDFLSVRGCHLCRVAGNTVRSHVACEFPYRCGNLANCYTLVTYLPPSQYMCEVCLIEQRDARFAFVPCGHQRFCASCVAQLEQQARGCPICRSEITMVLHLY